MDKKILMIGVSTAQNTTNVLPALQMKIDYFVALETSAAHKREWSKGMYSVLKKKGIKLLDPIILLPEEDSRIDVISAKLHNIIPENVEVLWNLGGGQKAQQFALWKTFTERVRKGYDEIACYANPESQKLEIWEYDESELSFSSVGIETNLTAPDIFEIYGFNLRVPNNAQFYQNKKLKSNPNGYYQLLDFKEFRKFFFKLPKTSFDNTDNQEVLSKSQFIDLASSINDNDLKVYFRKEQLKLGKNGKNIDESIIPALRKRIINNIKAVFNKPPQNEKIKIYDSKLTNLIFSLTGNQVDELEVSYSFFNKLFPEIKKVSFLFEEMLKGKIMTILGEIDNHIFEAYSNVHLFKDNNSVAEYDILFVTDWGTIIAIDAKTYGVTKKDIDARILNLREGAGRYINFVLSFPYYIEDIESNWFPNEIKNLPIWLRKLKLKYFILNNLKNSVKVTLSENEKDNEMDLIPIDNLLVSLGLIK